MKQKVISYLSTMRSEICEINKFIYENTEKSYEENTTSRFLIDILKKYNYDVTEGFCDIPTSFCAHIGSGHPKICLICKYSTDENTATLTGVNASTSITMGAAMALTTVIGMIENGSVYVIGCPGNDISGSELTMAKQGCFEDMDLIISPKAYNKNVVNVSSACVTPLNIKFSSESSKNGYANNITMDALNITCNSLNHLVKNLCDDCDINFVSLKGEKNPYLFPSVAEGNLYIRTKLSNQCQSIESSIRNYTKAVGEFLNIESEIDINETPSKELVKIPSLNKLFESNLKEKGIIKFEDALYEAQGISIGALSHTTPCTAPHISLCKDYIPYPSLAFGECSISESGFEEIIKAIEATASTIIDILERKDILHEITNDFYKRLTYH